LASESSSWRSSPRRAFEVDVLDAGGLAELGALEPAGELALLAVRVLGVDHHAEAILER